jgi:hypothetical protein
VLWAGSDDGLIHVSKDSGATWENVTPAAELLPEWALISIIEPSPHDASSAHVAARRYKLDDTAPYLLKTNDFGATWTAIVEGIPAHEFTRVIREDPNRRGLLFAATETGLFVSLDNGKRWDTLRGNLPVVPVYDLCIKDVEKVVASHGRSFWILDDLTPLHQMSDESSARRTTCSGRERRFTCGRQRVDSRTTRSPAWSTTIARTQRLSRTCRSGANATTSTRVTIPRRA